MNKMNKILSSVAAAAVLSSTAAVASISDKGNYLVTPAYFATPGGYETQIDVFNTNTKKAVIAKVVVREASCSQELKDFLIFLSPGDAFNAQIKVVDGKVKLFSKDDSVDSGVYINGENDLPKEGTAKAILSSDAGLDLISGSVFAPAANKSIVKASGTKLTDLDIFNGSKTDKIKFNANAGYVEVFTLLELDATELAANFGDTNWTAGKPLKKEYMVEFYDAITKKLNDDVTGINYGERNTNFSTYVNKIDADYAAAIKVYDKGGAKQFKNSKDKYWEIAKILNTDGTAPAATTVNDDYIEAINENLLTGTVTIKNIKDGSEAAMTTPMYSHNITGLTNRVFGERQAETNYVRVLNGNITKANAALKVLINATATSAVYVPYTKGKPSILNTLFLAKNLSNHKCLTKTSGSGASETVVGVYRQPVNYKSDIRNMEENVFKVASKQSPFSGYYVDSAEANSIWPELGQLHVKKVVDETNGNSIKFDEGWITVSFLKDSATDKFAYTVDESIVITDATDSSYPAVSETGGTATYLPSVLPSYMQVIGTSAGKTYTNIYRPASK